jgi:hypothetical protein
VIDLMIAPQTAALRALARPTAGTVVGYEVQLDEILAALGRRWRLWFTEPDAPADGHVASLAVSLPGKRKQVRAPEWVRSSTPEEIAEVRLEDLLAGRSLDGSGLTLSATIARVATGPAGLELRLEVTPVRLPEDAPAGPLRISYAWAGPDGATGIHHEILPAGDLTKGWRHAERLAATAGERRLAVIVEALGPETWGSAVLSLEDGRAARAQPAARRSSAASRTVRRVSPSSCGEKGFCRQMGESGPPSESRSSL